jgi:cellulose synthase/poly-beta-1,6-N-acetylglucosamine synthase-like glycosyltransferase
MDDAHLPSVAVLVSASNDADTIRDCLASLSRQDYPRRRHEIIVIDRGSTDTTRAIVEAAGARWLDAAPCNVSAARNAGLRATTAEIVAFTDPDCVAATGWLRALVRRFADANAGVVAGEIVPFPPRTIVERYASRRRSHGPRRVVAHRARSFGLGPNLAMRAALLRAAGGFDTRFPGGGWEDADLCWRLARDRRCSLVFAPKAVVFHRYRSTALGFVAQHFRYGYGLAVLRRKYAAEPDLFEAAAPSRSTFVTAAAHARHGNVERIVFPLLDALRVVGQRTGFALGSLRDSTATSVACETAGLGK